MHGQAVAETSVEHRSDEDPFAAYLDGDREAFAAIVQALADELVMFLTKQTGSRAAAEDVFQETFLQIHQSAGTSTFRVDSSPGCTRSRSTRGGTTTAATPAARMSLSTTIDASGEGQSFADLLESESTSRRA